jgi:hypothetical protein
VIKGKSAIHLARTYGERQRNFAGQHRHIATSGFSVAAKNHLEAEEIGHLTIPLKQAQGLRWIPLVEENLEAVLTRETDPDAQQALLELRE